MCSNAWISYILILVHQTVSIKSGIKFWKSAIYVSFCCSFWGVGRQYVKSQFFSQKYLKSIRNIIFSVITHSFYSRNDARGKDLPASDLHDIIEELPEGWQRNPLLAHRDQQHPPHRIGQVMDSLNTHKILGH